MKARIQKTYKSRARHSFRAIVIRGTCGFPWPICSACGLVMLKNEISQQAAARTCDAMDD